MSYRRLTDPRTQCDDLIRYSAFLSFFFFPRQLGNSSKFNNMSQVEKSDSSYITGRCTSKWRDAGFLVVRILIRTELCPVMFCAFYLGNQRPHLQRRDCGDPPKITLVGTAAITRVATGLSRQTAVSAHDRFSLASWQNCENQLMRSDTAKRLRLDKIREALR